MQRLAIMAAVAVSVAAIASGTAQAQTASQNQPGNQENTRNRSSSISVLRAADLINRPVTDQQGHDAGQVNQLVLNIKNGDIDFVLIASRGDFDLNGQVVAVPWSAFQTPQEGRGPIQLKFSAGKLAQAPRINPNALGRLYRPGIRRNIYGYYGYRYPYRGAFPSPYARNGLGYPNASAVCPPGRNTAANGNTNGSATQNNSGGNQNVDTRQTNGFGNTPPRVNAGGVNTRAINNAVHYPSKGSNDQNNNQRQNHPTQQTQNLVSTGLLIGKQGIVSALQSRATVSSRGLKSAFVYDRNGNALGPIDEVLIDADNGSVAFALIQRGGFLGLSPSWSAIPIQALHWSSFNGDYHLTINAQALQNEPSLPVNKKGLPSRVSGQQLAQLYQYFGVPSPGFQPSSPQHDAEH